MAMLNVKWEMIKTFQRPQAILLGNKCFKMYIFLRHQMIYFSFVLKYHISYLIHFSTGYINNVQESTNE